MQIVWILFCCFLCPHSSVLISSEKCVLIALRSILFLTASDEASDNVTDLVRQRNTNISATVFSFTLGDEADKVIAWEVATATGGIHIHTNDGDDDDFLTAVSSYYLYYAFGESYNNSDLAVTSPYLDFSSGVAMITMALPVYFEEFFIGVVGVDIPLTLLSEAIGQVVIGRSSYSFLVNQVEEVILHPLVANPLTTTFSVGDEYDPVYINNLEPDEFNVTKMMSADEGSQKIVGTVINPVSGRFSLFILFLLHALHSNTDVILF